MSFFADLTFKQWYVLAVIAYALVLFVTHWLRFDVVAISILILITLPGVVAETIGADADAFRLVTTDQALSGFQSEAIVVLASIFVIARALQRSGFSDWVAVKLQRYSAGSERGLFAMLLGLIGVLSAFVNNTAMTAMAIPVVLRCSNRIGVNPSRIYLPLALVSLVGGVMTLIGTTTNITVSHVLGKADKATIGMFEMLPAGAVFTLVAGASLFFLSPLLMRRKEHRETLFGKYNVKEFLSEILVKAESDIVGKPIQELHFGHEYDITIMGLVRDGQTIFAPPPTTTIRESDVLMVQGGVENIISLRNERRVELVNELRVEQGTLRSLDLYMAEVVLLPNSSFIGRTIRDIDLRDYYGITILAFARRGLQRAEHLADIPLRMGDTLLVQGHMTGIERLKRHPNLLVLETLDTPLSHRKLPIAIGILGALVVSCTLQTDAIFLNFLVAVLALIGTRCVALRDVYDSIDWRILVLIGCLLPVGTAVTDSRIIEHVEPLLPQDPLILLATIYLVTFGLTQVISNTASAALMTPIALRFATAAEVHHRPLIMAVAFAASFAFVTPFGHQACTLVMGPGNYKTGDYVRVGGVLGVILFAVAMWVIPFFFPF